MSQTIVRLYTRHQCHLCEEAKQTILELKKHYSFLLEEIDIAQDDKLTEQFGLMIPVVFVDGEEVLYGQINKTKLSKRLHRKITVF